MALLRRSKLPFLFVASQAHSWSFRDPPDSSSGSLCAAELNGLDAE